MYNDNGSNVCLPFANIGNSSLYDIMLIPNFTSGKDVYILATDTLNRWSRTVGPITWFNPPKHGLQSRAICGGVCALSIAVILF